MVPYPQPYCQLRTCTYDRFYSKQQINGSFDRIVAVISDPFTDDALSNSQVTMFELQPCHYLTVALELQSMQRLNRDDAKCLTNYPPALANLLANPMPTQSLYNPVFAPTLPYNLGTCAHLCQSAISLQECGCVAQQDAWWYMGGYNSNYSYCNDHTII